MILPFTSAVKNCTQWNKSWEETLMSRIERSYKFYDFSFEFQICVFSLNSTRFTKTRCLNDFSAHCYEIYSFMLIHQQAPACGFYKM